MDELGLADRQWRLLHCEHEAACFIGKLGGLKNDAVLGSWGEVKRAGEVLLHGCWGGWTPLPIDLSEKESFKFRVKVRCRDG